MTDKNRQKGNESVGEKSDGLARDIDAREALQRKYGTLGTVEDAAAFIERKAEAHASDFGYGVGGTLCFGRQEEMDHYATLTELAEELRMLARPAPEALPSATKRLIGWRTDNYLWETSDPEMAKNWEPHHTVLPIFEGDAETALAAPAPAAQAPKCATCNDNGMIGGPSYYAPDEGGVPCPDCAAPADAASEANKRDAVTCIGEFVCGEVEWLVGGPECGDYEIIYTSKILDEINENHQGKSFAIYIDSAAIQRERQQEADRNG